MTAVTVLNYLMGAVHVACGGCFAVFGTAFAGLLAGAASMDADVEDPEAFQAIAGFAGGVFVVVGIVIVLLALPAFLAGYGVQGRKQWGRILTIVLAVLSGLLVMLHAINLSPGVLLYGGYTIYTLVILLQPQYAEEFS